MARYTGGCHCGAVRYEVEMDLGTVYSCNCSMCAKTGWLLAFAPATAFTLTKGQDDVTDYRFNKKIVEHLFCAHCGIKSFGRGKGPDGTDTVAINVRCLDGVDVDALTVQKVDGKSL